MARSARPWAPDAIYHVDARAHDGAPIFDDEEDRAFVVGRAALVFRESGIVCLGWSILVNHYHMLIRCPDSPGRALQRLNTAIARRVRRRRGGAGAVFQGRFFSGVCTDESSTSTRLAYVTANPVHHRVVPTVQELLRHPWSSVGEVYGLREARLADPEAALAVLHPSPDVARRSLVDLLVRFERVWETRTGAIDRDEPPPSTLDMPRRVRDEVRVPDSLGSCSGPLPRAIVDWEGRQTRRCVLRAQGWTPDRLADAVCAALGVDAAFLRAGRRSRAVAGARSIIAHVACDHVGWPLVEVALAVGTSSTAVARARTRGAAALQDLECSAEELVRRGLETT